MAQLDGKYMYVDFLDRDEFYQFILNLTSEEFGNTIADKMKEEEVSGSTFMELEEKDIKDLFPKMGPRKCIQKLLDSIRTRIYPQVSISPFLNLKLYSTLRIIFARLCKLPRISQMMGDSNLAQPTLVRLCQTRDILEGRERREGAGSFFSRLTCEYILRT